MADSDIHTQIDELIAREHELRDALARGELDGDDERQQLRDAEKQLDRLWDLLRQRSAKREFGEDPSGAHLRSAKTVEDYTG